MFETVIVGFQPSPGAVELGGVPVLVDSEDYEGIQIAASNLTTDLERVTGKESCLWTDTNHEPREALILVGSLEKSRFIRELISRGTINAKKIEGKWEAFTTTVQNSPFDFVKKVIVIAGSDRRGTIFGIYTLSEQMGVSPWYWWADVPVKKHLQVFALPVTTYQGEPSIQYRGIFINDEAPSLTSWVLEKFGPVYNSEFYKKVFELLLRMKANFLWPAMWSGNPGSSFFTDDPLNQKLADVYGIVMSTSHHEPMQRGMTEWKTRGAGEWSWIENKENIVKYFEEGAERAVGHESFITIGMRGAGDVGVEGDNPRGIIQSVLDTQRKIIGNAYGKEDGERQLIALYKEVLEYYEQGLDIPEDVTLMFTDDNFGNIRRLPTSKERERKGGAGVYYHLEYVGTPRGYKWLNSSSCGKIYQQLRTAHDQDAKKIWVINCGDIKPQELPLTFIMTMAWNIEKITPTSIRDFFKAYAAREFGPEHADEIANLLLAHDRLNALRRHEHIEPETYSILHYQEADRILARYTSLEADASALLDIIGDEYKGAFFQIVLHPIKASRINLDLRVSQEKNRLYGLQRRNSTNVFAQRVLDLFDADFTLSEEYHDSPWTGTKWNHIMRQPHYGYGETWYDPSRNLITGISFIQPRQDSNPMAGYMGLAVEGHPGIRPGLINEESDKMQPSRGALVPGMTLPMLCPNGTNSRYFEVYSRGSKSLHWTASVTEEWIHLSRSAGTLLTKSPDQRVEISIDWTKVPIDFDDVIDIHVRSTRGDYEQVHLPVSNRQAPREFHGFLESDGYISIEPGAVLLSPEQELYYENLPFVGRTSSGAVSLRCDQALKVGRTADIVFLEYPMFVFSKTQMVTINLQFTMVLDTDPENLLTYDICFDDESESSVRLLEDAPILGDLPLGWTTAVGDGVWKRSHSFQCHEVGSHSLKFRALAKGIALEKIVVEVRNVRESYLGPPMSSLV